MERSRALHLFHEISIYQTGDIMAARKYYAVKKGKVTGVFQNWDECRSAVEGYSGARYKGFSTLEEAKEYLKGADLVSTGFAEKSAKAGNVSAGKSDCRAKKSDKTARIQPGDGEEKLPPEGELLAYVDGSYDDRIKKYAFGCVFLLPDGRIYTEYGNGDNEQSLQHRNVTGEMLGAMYAVRFAMLNGFHSVEIRYDYQGIEKWVTGEWRSKTELTRKYAVSMQEWGKNIAIGFTKVAAHANVTYNELADKMAKTGLTMGNGVPNPAPGLPR